MITQDKPAYWAGLDTLRAFAAVVVVFSHTGAFYPVGFPQANGPNAVRLFFALSGFLITLLLLREREKTGTIDLRAFFLRRALRIMPLYFLFIAVVVAIPTLRPTPDVIGAALVFMVPLIPTPELRGSFAHLWSLGLEECFYLGFPALVKYAGVLRTCIGLIVVHAALDLFTGHPLLKIYNFDAMAIGGLVAWVTVYQPLLKRYLLSAPAAWSAALLSVATLFTPVQFADAPLAAVYAVFVANAAFNPRFSRIHWNWSTWLGQRSYGLYVIHYPITILALGTAGVFSAVGGIAFIFAVTLILTALSYRYYETPFLQLKARITSSHGVMPSVAPAGD
jgi:peptidoglycan/LPS O-acetylase OafA/YrhL